MLIGSVHNYAFRKDSIPYRLATNRRKIMEKKVEGNGFQFLIGWLQTYRAYGGKENERWCFNSL